MSEVQTTARIKLTTAEKIAAIDTKIEELGKKREELALILADEQAAAAKAEALANVKAGDKVAFEFGRKENRTNYVGSVVYAGEGKVKVLVGAGADTKLLEVKVSDLDSIVQGVAVDLEAEQAAE